MRATFTSLIFALILLLGLAAVEAARYAIPIYLFIRS